VQYFVVPVEWPLPSGLHTASTCPEWKFGAPPVALATTARINMGAIVTAALNFVMPWRRRQLALKNLLEREPLDDDAVYSRFYASAGLPKAEVLNIWHDIADTLRVPADRIRPDDHFGKEIGVYWITSEDLDVLAAKGRARAKKLGLAVDLEKLSTVDEYVRCFAR
jgi:hypothetical protein